LTFDAKSIYGTVTTLLNSRQILSIPLLCCSFRLFF